MEYIREQTNEIEIPAEVFYRIVAEKIANYNPDLQERVIGRPPYIQWNNMKISRGKWLIEKSPRPIDGFTSSRSSGGRIEVKVIDGTLKTILKATIRGDTAPTFMIYLLGFTVGMAGLAYTIVDFNVYVLIVVVLIEALLFTLLPKIMNSLDERGLEDLTRYYNYLLRELQK